MTARAKIRTREEVHHLVVERTNKFVDYCYAYWDLASFEPTAFIRPAATQPICGYALDNIPPSDLLAEFQDLLEEDCPVEKYWGLLKTLKALCWTVRGGTKDPYAVDFSLAIAWALREKLITGLHFADQDIVKSQR